MFLERVQGQAHLGGRVNTEHICEHLPNTAVVQVGYPCPKKWGAGPIFQMKLEKQSCPRGWGPGAGHSIPVRPSTEFLFPLLGWQDSALF